MKYPAKIYAKAIAELAGKFNDKKIANLRKLLDKNGDRKRIKEIIGLAERYILQKQGKKKITIESPRILKESQKKALIGSFGSGNIVEEKINPELIAGVKIMLDGEKQFDASMQKKLKNIFKI